MDRNRLVAGSLTTLGGSLSARRAWIEITCEMRCFYVCVVALRKESVDRNSIYVTRLPRCQVVALRKESVDRNAEDWLNAGSLSRSLSARRAWIEMLLSVRLLMYFWSLSARRAWIEIAIVSIVIFCITVALRKESVDRNKTLVVLPKQLNVALRKESVDRNLGANAPRQLCQLSLSARRAWIEISQQKAVFRPSYCRSPQGERG